MINWILGSFVHKKDVEGHIAEKTYDGMSVLGYKCSKCGYRWYEKRQRTEKPPMPRSAPPPITIQSTKPEQPSNPRKITELELRERVIELEKIVKILTDSIEALKENDDSTWLKHFNEIMPAKS
jgi:hypothetical protein